ncbi:spermidine synthase [Adlercreutzia sp. ZJ242]|uniref:spermidine synthase n=1 Tax=Adlercreutzia sp. ZJ242 TaxID=2709409 RepID=UPI0013EC9683|nr:fused MFS/spermidine synthase [Adlercreutzia sp. ZJ242]
MAKTGVGKVAGLAGRAKGAALVAAGVGVTAANALAVRKLLQLDPHVRRTDAGLARVYTVCGEDGERVRVLNVGGAYQSATYLGERWHEPVFEYYRAFDRMFEAEGAVAGSGADADAGVAVEAAQPADGAQLADATCSAGAAQPAGATRPADAPFAIRDVLMIGGGGCAWPKHALMTRPGLRVDVVESDPAVAEIARRFFFVDKLERELSSREGSAQRFNLIVDDGLGYLAGCEKRYDAICNDAFAGAAAAADLAGAAGLRAVKDRLNPGGLYLVNVVSGPEWREFRHLIRLINELDRFFAHVTVIFASDERFSDKDNYLVIASDAEYAFSDVIPTPERKDAAC